MINSLNVFSLRLVSLVFIALLMNLSWAAEETVWIDVRSLQENQTESIPGTIHIPHTEIGSRIAELDLDKSTPIRVFCASGVRSGLAEKTLKDLGFSNVENIGGFADAKQVIAAAKEE